MARWKKPRHGTRFRVYPQVPTLPPFGEPEVITIARGPRAIRPGPRDRAIHTIDLRRKGPFHDEDTHILVKEPVLPPVAAPLDPVRAGPGGHFDHLEPGTRAFRAAHVYAVVRAVLDVWEHFLGRSIGWYFAKDTPVLYLFPQIASGNAWSGAGFLEFGWAIHEDPPGGRAVRRAPFAENFDLIAHEVGHLVMKDVVGNPPAYEKSTMFRAHEEAGADLVACVAALRFDRVLDAVLDETKGNLLTINTLSRFGAWAAPDSTEVFDEQPADTVDAFFADDSEDHTEVRRFVHGLTMAKVAESDDLDKHELSKPYSAAAYEVLARMFERRLVARGLIPQALADAAGRPRISRAAARTPRFAARYVARPFRAALEQARDDFGTLLARTWTLGAPWGSGLSFAVSAANMVAADAALFRGAHRAIIQRAFERRGIVPARPA